MTGALLLLAGLAAAQAEPTLAPGTMAVVLPFENPDGVSRLHWMREGVAWLVGDRLGAAGVSVISRDERALAYERLQLPVAASLTRASAIRVGHAVGATAMVTGRLVLVDNELEVRARVIRLEAGILSSEVIARGDPGDLFAIVGRLVSELAPGPGGSTGWSPPPSLPAFELFTRGLAADTPAAARDYFEEALAAAPDYDAVRLALWTLHTEQGAHARALASVASVEPGRPSHPEARYATAMSQVALERWAEAFATLRELQGAAPSAEVANALGVVQLRRGASVQTGRATYYFNQATEIDPREADFFFNLGYAYWLDKDPNAAVYWLREAVRRDPADGDAHFVLSAALQRIDAAAESARELELATRLSSRYAEWQERTAGRSAVPRGLERLHTRLDRPAARIDAALASTDQRNQAELAAFHLDAARRAYQRESDTEALRELRRALFLAPYLAEAHILLGRVQLRAGRPDEALRASKIAVWSEENLEGLLVLAEAALAAGETATARDAVARALVLAPRSADALALQARLPPPD